MGMRMRERGFVRVQPGVWAAFKLALQQRDTWARGDEFDGPSYEWYRELLAERGQE